MDAVREPTPATPTTDPTPLEPPPATAKPAEIALDSDAIELAHRLSAILRRPATAPQERSEPTPVDDLPSLS